MENREWRGEIRPTLIVGIGEWGARVVDRFAHRVDRRAGRLPVVRAVTIVAGEGEGEETRFCGKNLVSTGLEQIRRLDAVQETRRAGWHVEGKTGSGVVLVASLGDSGARGTVSEVSRLLRALSERDFAYRLALSGVFLLPRDAEQGAEGDTEGEGVARQKEIPADDLLLFDEGCYLLDEVNADGLLVTTGEKQADMVANWLVLWVMTPLQAALDRMPPSEAGCHFDTFGLAAWEFPLESLAAHLARRWQWEVLGRLLAPPAGDGGTVTPFLERHGQAGVLWLQEAPLHFRVAGDTWAAPPLGIVRTLREEIDKAVEAEYARLQKTLWVSENPKGLGRLDAVCGEAQQALAAEVNVLLDGLGLGAGEGFLVALEDTARTRATQLEREVKRCRARVAKLDELADRAGRVLDDLTRRFPPCQLRTLLGLAFRPWRLLHLWLLYREIGRRSGVYLAYRQSQWLLQAESREHQWQAAFYVRLAQAAKDEKEAIAQLRDRLEQLRECLAPDPVLKQALGQRLEAAALLTGLADYFYRRVTGDGEAVSAGLLALYGPLSRWVRDGWEAETIGLILAEHAHEQFAFLDEVRLDELLARTHSGARLRRRIAALVEAAAVWWACDEPALSAGDRARLRRLVLVGLPDADSSLLVDLLPDCPVSCFSTGDRYQVVVVQVIQGLPLTGSPP